MLRTAVAFRPLREEDIPLLTRWLSTPEWVRWWAPPITVEEARAKYLPRIRGEEPVHGFVILVDGREVGYVQWYRVVDFPETMELFALDEERARATAGVDLGIGEPDAVGRGIGRAVLRQFVEDVVFEEPGIDACMIDPDPANERAVRCYRAAGFVDRGIVSDGKTGEQWLVMEWRG